ncbi:MAG: selenium metabolism-associated LysR family transcriptional regulator [Lachnospiraceae bacterium]
MDFKQIEAFMNVVKYKNFSKAADASFLTQPTISAHINNLEKELGVLLLDRSGREATLTKQGEVFYPFAVNMLNTRSQAMFSMKNISIDLNGVLELGVSSIPGQYFVPKMVAQFHKAFPKVRFYVDQSDSRNVIESILNQRGEIGFTGCKLNNSLVYEPIFTDKMVLMTPAKGEYAHWKEGTVSQELLKRQKLITREEGSGTKMEMEHAKIEGLPIYKSMNLIARMNSFEAIREAVAYGMGVSIVSDVAARHEKNSQDIRFFQIEGLEHRRTFYLIYNQYRSLSPIGEQFIKMVLKERQEGL